MIEPFTAEDARAAYGHDLTVTNEEYGRLVEEADEQDQERELEAEAASSREEEQVANLMDQKLVWLTEEDHAKVNLAVNICGSLLNQDLNPSQIFDLDGDPIDQDLLNSWNDAHHEAVLALCRTKYVPEDALPKLRLILMSE